MIDSMTGYGEAQGEAAGVSYAVEVKALNNRYLKTTIKLPELLSFLEGDIDKLLKKNLARGTVHCVVRFKEISASALFDIDETALRAVVDKLGRLCQAHEIAGKVDIGGLLDLPGIIKPVHPDEDEARIIRQTVLQLVQDALDSLKEMRKSEGAALLADLTGHCKGIAEDLEQVKGKSDTVVHDYAKRLKHRVDTLLAEAKLKLDEETLAREVAVLADRSDISEEIARLDSHLQQFEQICGTGGQAGRRLDFLSQEMLREANTIASKASDADIIRLTVDVKCRIDRIKEQVQNVE